MSGFSSIFGGGARCQGFHSFSAYAKTEGSSLKGTVILPISCAGGQLQSEMKLWGLLHHETVNSTCPCRCCRKEESNIPWVVHSQSRAGLIRIRQRSSFWRPLFRYDTLPSNIINGIVNVGSWNKSNADTLMLATHQVDPRARPAFRSAYGPQSTRSPPPPIAQNLGQIHYVAERS